MVALLDLIGIVQHIIDGVLHDIPGQYVEATSDMADMTSSETSAHKEFRVSQMKNSEANVKKITEAVSSFTNPFALKNKEELYCLSSGVPATQKVS